jgi:hypothetical protein
MRNRQLRKYILALIITIPLIIGISFVQTKINTIKEREKLTNTEIIKNAPPVVAFVTVALGSFRGLLADILWLRAASLQEKGQYFEMVQLASWITKLQPKFTGATAYLAWNMAYNISVTCSSFEDRWRWVQRGIELIRDEALVYNPADPVLYKELGWIYQHKIGNMMDDAHQFYKNRMALAMMEVLGKTKVDWNALAAAPKTEKELGKILKLDNDFWNDLTSGKAKSKIKYRNMAALEKDFRLFGELPEDAKKALKYDKKSIALLDNYLRAKWLREKYKLDPEIIYAINKKYGNLDWRLPEAHAIYWAKLGIKKDVSGEVNTQCDRMITQSLKDAFMGGQLVMADPDNPETFLTIPNLELADSAIKAFGDAYKRQKSSSFKDGMRNFLSDIIVMMYTFGKYKKAEKYLKMLQKEEPHNLALRLGLDYYVMKEWKEDAKDATVKQAEAIIGSRLYSAYYLAACGEDDASDSNLKLAEGVYNIYKTEHKSSWKRVGFSFEKLKDRMKELVRVKLIQLKQYSEERRRIEDAPVGKEFKFKNIK